MDSKRLYRIAFYVSAVIGLFLSVVESFSKTGFDLLGAGLVSLTSAISFLVVVSFYTDHKYRNVDRVLLRAALIPALILGAVRMAEIQIEPLIVLYIVGLLIAFSTMFAPTLGASDSRAYVLAVAFAMPFLGHTLTYYILIAGTALWIGYGVVYAIKNRTTKVSIPMVPYILLPLAATPIVSSAFYGVPRMIEVLQ